MKNNPAKTNSAPLRLVIVGGVAAGASAAARARRLNEAAQITIIERGPDVSFANCGLPYFIGGEIEERAALAVQTPQSLKAMLNVEVLVNTEAIGIERKARAVHVRNRETGTEDTLPYDRLILATGASPLRPPVEGIDDSRVLTLRNLQDMDRIKERAASAGSIAVIGAGFIGLEMTEQLVRLGKKTTLVELVDQVLPPLDRSMTLLIEDELRAKGVDLILSDGIDSFECEPILTCCLRSGRRIDADLVILSVGVRPDTELARAAGLALGERGHVQVNAFMQTSDPVIYAAGDAVETKDTVTGCATAVPLGGPANRQGRTAADHIFLGDKTRPYPGSMGTAIVRVFDVTAGLTGWPEKRLKASNQPYLSVTVGDNHHAGYFPGAKPLTLKLLWHPDTGRILGAEVTGFEGVDKRIDVLATAIAGRLTVGDLCHLELAYAPPFGAAKDIVNLAGFAATNLMDGLVHFVDELPSDSHAQILDLRPPALVDSHPLLDRQSINIPLPALRKRIGELDRERPVTTVCALGKTAYFGERILAQHGFNASTYSGGIRAKIDPRTPARPPKT